ncbi:DUF4159 domain-containing protein [Brumimicrobium oceani]|uniref:DUF4159 domain-containing protein n=1 Tax=Brumimicrobium oceani TaxID=2100725 RepID=A0A2U2XGR1_9FLAO|nr:DUF4159 domain-containing protein [Brumimicrobium oceani]PWH86988.1 hypothetical protein DIT68_01645 [Brumimicrobium oceani]
MRLLLIIFSFFISNIVFGQGSYQLAVLKYNGGGDYYANPTAVPNLVKFANQQLNANINPDVPYVDAGSPLLFTYPFVHMTGHGNVVFSNSERENLRNYLIGGGFLHIDDNYGMDQYIRPEIEKLFPNLKLVELPYDHPIFDQKYKFNGLPKIHEHDNQRAQAFGILIEGRLVLLYTYETDLGDGWEDITVHNDTQENHEKALKMGLNILQFALINGGLE